MDEYRPRSPRRFAALAIGFELSVGLLAVALGAVTGPWPWQSLLTPSAGEQLMAALLGLVAAAILFASVVLIDRYPWRLLAGLQETIRRFVVPLFRGLGTPHLLAIAIAAGVGEELLFRGYCQAALQQWLPEPVHIWLALLIASLLFGVCHWVSAAYAVVASVMGLLLGALFLVTDNLLAPIVAHSVYDFLALLYLTRKEN